MNELYAVGGNVRGKMEVINQNVSLSKLRSRLNAVFEVTTLVMLSLTAVAMGLLVFSFMADTNGRTVINHTATTYMWQTVAVDHGFFTFFTRCGGLVIALLFVVTLLCGLTSMILAKEPASEIASTLPVLLPAGLVFGIIAALLAVVAFVVLSLCGVVKYSADDVNVQAGLDKWLHSSMSNPPKVVLNGDHASGNGIVYGYNQQGTTTTIYNVKISDDKVELQQVP